MKKKNSFIMVIMCLLMLILSACTGTEKAKMPDSSASLMKKDKDKVVSMLKDAGFKNIMTQERATDKDYRNGEIYAITVNGKTEYFVTGKAFDVNSEIMISYYTYIPPEEAEEQAIEIEKEVKEADKSTMTEDASDDGFTERNIEYAKAIAKNVCERYLAGATYPDSGYYIGNYDDKGAIYVYTDALKSKASDGVQSMYFVFTPKEKDFDLSTPIEQHLLMVGSGIYIDDGYCENIYDIINKISG